MPSVTLRVADAMRQSGYLPDNRESLAKAVKAKLTGILSSPGLKPLDKPPVPVPSTHVNIWISAMDAEKTRHLTEKIDPPLSPGMVLSALLWRDFEAWKKSSMEKVKPETLPMKETRKRKLYDILAARQMQVRPEQRRMLAAMDRLLDDPSPASRVMFLEAGTGTGKTLAYLSEAIEIIQKDPERLAVIAVPSLALISQVAQEIEKIPEAERPSYLTLSGQSEWISATALQEFLEEQAHRLPEEQVKALKAWQKSMMDGKGQAIGDFPRWSRQSLLAAVPEFAFIEDITVFHRLTDVDEGYAAYRAQFTAIKQSSLVIMTHAMLAVLLKYRLMRHYQKAREEGNMEAVIAQWNAAYRDLPYMRRSQKLFEAVHDMLGALSIGDDDLDNDAGFFVLPAIDFLVIDEAHQFEDAANMVFNLHFSLWGLVHDARELVQKYPRRFSSSALKDIEKIEAEAREMGKQLHAQGKSYQDTVQELHATDPQGILARLDQALMDFLARSPSSRDEKDGDGDGDGENGDSSSLTPAQPKASGKKGKASSSVILKRVRRIAYALHSFRAIYEKHGEMAQSAAFLHWSPQRDYPRITMGRTSIDRELHYLWTVLAHRTALVSGTLYESIPMPSYETIRRGLAVPQALAMGMQPIHADWQIKPVTLYLIGKSLDPMSRLRFEPLDLDQDQDDQEQASPYAQGLSFVRPAAKMENNRRKVLREYWLDDIARYVSLTYSTSVGGVLVLGTAFADLDDLAARLVAQGIQPLVHRAGVDLAGLKMAFIEQKRAGHKPILLAAGAAWTGFDLHDPEDNDLLTDLVILNAPLGIINRTVSRMRRMSHQRIGHYEVAYQALRLVRQACGRLVRTELPESSYNRRIHFLDARIHDPQLAGLLSPIKRFLSQYKTVTTSA